MAKLNLDFGTVVKLILWSTVVGALLYWLDISTGDIYGWIINKLAMIWGWLSGTGLKYMLLGATIVVPIFIISRLRKG
ncbi:DUF6460 domain-containing protein [Kordiimonas pumila]|uniref:DUF6460 domain-containing protein n=1 Tax=Kordiimonas pumila TaxID=2161677 RepID=A0ABV7D5P2_9PROT|nr:DUF6460 domain-containing protein [Kordiimonas pumila]